MSDRAIGYVCITAIVIVAIVMAALHPQFAHWLGG